MIIKTAIKLSIVFITLLISGCDSFRNDSLSSICDNFPALCEDLHQIGDCRFKRTTVIRARYYKETDPTVTHKYNLLTELDEYQSCLELTLFVEFTRNKHRKEQRLHNYLRAGELITQEVKENAGTKDPILAYYLWTHHQDDHARRVFLAAANKGDVTNPNLLFKLAIIKTKETPQKALGLFYRGLSLTNSIDEVPRSTFVYIMTIFYQHRQFENAYVWALLAKMIDEENEFPINLGLILKKGIVSGDQLITNEKQLQAKADRYYNQLDLGNFNTVAPRLR